jgi:hypothetical protein
LSGSLQNASAADHEKGTIRLPHPIKQKIKDGIVAVSVANFCFLNSGFDLLFDSDRFFDKLPVTPTLLLALMANLSWLAVVIWLGMQWRRRSQNRALHLVLDLVFLLLVLVPLDFIRMKILNITDYQLFMFLKQPMVMLGTLVIFAVVVWQHGWTARAAAAAAAIASPLAFSMLAKNVLVCLGIMQLGNCVSEIVLPPPGPVPAGQPRVVWIIFDETDYRIAFEQRPPGVSLPAFDRLRNESLFATAAYAPADGTIISMPALIIGRRLSTVTYESTCDLKVMFVDTGAMADCSTLPSVFSEARRLGVNTAVVGWYIPYDRLLPNALNHCAWWPLPSFEPARAATFPAEMWQQIYSLTGTVHSRQMSAKMFHDSFIESLSVVTNNTYGLVLLHLPPPHRPGVYLPDQNRFTAWPMSKVKGYFNNLILADHELGAFRQAMETSGEWDKTWVILSADHSWRQSGLYDGKRDMRVPFLVRPPKGGEATAYSLQFNTVLTHDLILTILRGEITNGQNVATWLDAHRSSEGNIPAPTKLE